MERRAHGLHAYVMLTLWLSRAGPSACASRGDEITTLGEAIGTRIQWSKYRILIPPRTRQPNSITATGSRGTASDAGTAAQHLQEKAQQ
jgi:hypothetical protein